MGQFTHQGIVYEELPDGQVRVVGHAQQPVQAPLTIGTRDPATPYEVRSAAAKADVDEYRANTVGQPELSRGFRWKGGIVGGEQEIIPGGPADPKNKPKSATEIEAENKRANEGRRAATISSIMGRVRQLYKDDVQGQPVTRLFGAGEKIGSWLGTPRMERFNAAGNAMLPLIRPLVAQTAKEGDSDKEMEVFKAYIPSAGDSDITIEEKLSMLEKLIDGMVDGKAPSQTLQSPPGTDREDGVLMFRDQVPTDPLAGMPKLSPEDEAFIRDNARFMSAQGIEQWFAQRNQPLPEGQAQQVLDALAKNPDQRPGIRYDEEEYRKRLQDRNEDREVGYLDLGAAGFTAGSTPVLAGLGGGVGSLMSGGDYLTGYREARDAERLRLEEGRDRLGIPGMLAEGAGMIPGMLMTGGASAAAAPRVASFLPRAARGLANDVGFGTVYGANEGDPLGGAAFAAGGNVAGNVVGDILGRGAAGVRNFIVNRQNLAREAAGLPQLDVPTKPTRAQRMFAAGVNRSGHDAVRQQMEEAQRLGLPMTLADTAPELRTLVGSAVRRSPTASGVAENVLLPRSRGQVDRFNQAIERDLGPTANLYDQSDVLMRQAQERAAPLYDEAYAAPARTSDELESLLATPFGRSALARARTIAANERRDPTKMGFDLDAQGEVILTRTPSMQTLDYVKRGMDDVLEQYRNPVTNKLVLDEAGRAQNKALREFLAEVDRLNPAYKEARAAYSGPASQKTALMQGKDAIHINPDAIPRMTGRMSPEELGQFRLGMRSGLSEAGERQRYSTNPFENILGTPAMEQRLGAAFDDPSQLFRQRDLERQMAQTNTDILGNSKTAQRQLADEEFAGGGIPQAAVDIGANLAMGQMPIGTVMRSGMVQGAKDAFKLGIGRKGRDSAEELAPLLINPNISENLTNLDNIVGRAGVYDDYVQRFLSNARTGGRMFAAPITIAGAGR